MLAQSPRVVVPSAWAEPIKIVDQVKSTPPLENSSVEIHKPQRSTQINSNGYTKTVRRREKKIMQIRSCNLKKHIVIIGYSFNPAT